MKYFGAMMMLMGVAVSAVAGQNPVPEINGASAASAIALVSGGLLVVRGRKK